MADVEPAAQAYPAVQAPVQVDTVRPVVEPYLPAAHGPVQVATLSPVVDPYLPAGHAVQDVAVVMVL